MNGAHRSYVYLAPPSAPLSGANRSESSIAFDDRPNGSYWAEGSQLSERRTIRCDRDEFPSEGRRGPLPHFAHLRLRSEEHTSELQSQSNLVCRLLLEKKKTQHTIAHLRPALVHLHGPEERLANMLCHLSADVGDPIAAC